MKEKSIFSSLMTICMFSALVFFSCGKKDGDKKSSAERESTAGSDLRGDTDIQPEEGLDPGHEKFVPDFPDISDVEIEPDGRKVELRLKLKKGQTIRMRTINEQKIHQIIQGMEQSMEQVIGMGMTMDVKDVDDEGNAEISTVYHWIKFTQKGGPARIAYDSDNPPVEIHPAVKMLAALKGKGFTMRLNPLGKVLAIKGAEEMLKKAMAKADLPPGPQAEALKHNLSEQFSDEALKKSMENLLAVYPEEPVGVGSRWNIKGEGTGAFSMVLYNTYVVEKLEKDTAVLKLASTVSAGGNGQAMKVGNMEMKYSLKGSQGGKVHLDLETGFIERSELTQDISGTVEVDLGGGKTMNWPIKIKSKVRMIPETEK